MNKLLVICGPTATGKTNLGVQIAKKFNGEIISADSRQVYIGMDIGTGKDINENVELSIKNQELGVENQNLTIGFREKEGIPIWLIDIVEPDYVFNVGEYARLGKMIINYLWSKNKLPIIVGGTGLYIKALTQVLPNIYIPPNADLRKKLELMTVAELQVELKKSNNDWFTHLNISDKKNPRRLIRAIEIVSWKKNVMLNSFQHLNIYKSSFQTDQGILKSIRQAQDDNLTIGLTAPLNDLFRRIDARVEARVKAGIIAEITTLLKNGFGWDLASMSGLGYKEWQEYFKALSVKRIAFSENEELIQKIVATWKKDEYDYAKRQLTWFKKEKHIQWFDTSQNGFENVVVQLVGEWYTKVKQG